MRFNEMSKEELLLFKRFDTIYRNNGFDPETEREMTMKDTLDVPQASYMIPRVLTQFVQEGVEPMLIGSRLLQRIEYTPGMTTVFPALDTLSAREVGDGMALPIFNISIGGAQTYGVSVSRHGLALRVDSKFINQSTYPWLAWWLKLAGQALARHQEEFIFSFISELGINLFNNDANARKPTSNPQPILGITTGRDMAGKFNGSVTMDDIFDGYAQVLMQGFVPDTLLVHPMTWLAFVKDPVLRDFALTAGGGSFFANWTGNAHAQSLAGQYNHKGLGHGLGQTGQYSKGALVGGPQSTVQGLPQNQNSAPVLPSYLGLNFRILVSPFVKYDPINKTTDMMMFDSSNLGALVVDEDPHVRSWTEPEFSINNIGIETRFGFGILNEGQAIGTYKNVAVKPNEWFPMVYPHFDISSDDNNNTFQRLSGVTVFGDSPISILS